MRLPTSPIAWLLTFLIACGSAAPSKAWSDTLPPGWTARAPREEIRPHFSFQSKGGPTHTGTLRISHDHREGLDGWFERSFPVTGGEFYQFQALRKTTGVKDPRRSALVRVLWRNNAGESVPPANSTSAEDDRRKIWIAEPEHPVDRTTDKKGWTTVAGIYRAPVQATHAVVELHLQWAPKGQVDWSHVELSKTSAPAARPVRLATVHYKPTGKSPRQNCEEYASLIAEAAQQRADLVVLGETVPAVGIKRQVGDVAEPIPGPTTDYFGQLAAKHQLHIVLSLNEREAHAVYNTAVLLGSDGHLIGKYRKVCLPHGEVEAGVAPGKDYPVFDTKLGKIGLMVCYDGFFPEVARELTNRGAEVIAWPVWGCNPLLAQARACENHVFLVSSTYMDTKDDWMTSSIFDRAGKPMATASKWGTVAVAEVDLAKPYVGPYNLGDFRSMTFRHRP